MTQLLISVKNAAEAKIAIENGCGWLDVKDPAAGALGMANAASLARITECVQTLRKDVPVSAALGDFHDWQSQTFIPPILNEFDYVKVGPAGTTDEQEWLREWTALQARFEQADITKPRWIAAFYADAATCQTPQIQTIPTILSQLPPLSVSGLLIDTCKKENQQLPHYCSANQIKELLHLCQELEIVSCLAGQLRSETIDLFQSQKLCPDYFAVRSAVCAGSDRNKSINPKLVSLFISKLHNLTAR